MIHSYYANLRLFAQASGTEIILERIEALSEQVASGHATILQDEQQILKKLDELKLQNAQAPLATPKEVVNGITEIRKRLQVKADEAEAAYNTAYGLFNRYRFREAVPYLQQALATVPLPEFYFALGRTYFYEADLEQAEKVLREGLGVVRQNGDEKIKALLTFELGRLLWAKRDLNGSSDNMQKALSMFENLYGPDHPAVAICASLMGQILQDEGGLDEALTYSERALNIDEKVYGPDSPALFADTNNVGQILLAKGDRDKALVTRSRR